jgi:sugar-specific transcriptional regulator TrmB
MSTLYELTADFQNLLMLAEDPDTDPQAFADTLEGIEGAIEDKADNYARVIRNLEADAAACDAESKRLRNKKQTIENNIKRMKSALQFAMQMTGKTKFKTALFTFGIRKNPVSVVIDAANVRDFPEQYIIESEPILDKRALKDALKAGEDMTGLCHLEQSESLSIR